MAVLLMLLLSQHVVISARAGLVTYAEGVVSVPAREHVGQGNVLRTGPSGRAEVLLQADAYLRVPPFTDVRLVSDALDAVELELTEGASIIEIREIEDDFPIRIRLAGLEATLHREGVYLFEPDRVSVLEGELAYGDGLRLRSGNSLVRTGEAFSQTRTAEDLDEHELVQWSQGRSEALGPQRARRTTRPVRF